MKSSDLSKGLEAVDEALKAFRSGQLLGSPFCFNEFGNRYPKKWSLAVLNEKPVVV